MVSKSTKKKQKQHKGTISKTLIVIIIILAVLLGGYYYFYVFKGSETKQTEQKEATATEKKESALKSLIDGTWVSKYDGAMLTINGLSFTLELPSVDKQVIIAGTIRIKGQTAIFKNISSNANCKGSEGTYQFSMKNKELLFKLVSDNCSSRKERMTAGWFRL